MNIDEHARVADLALDIPGATRVFDTYRIDYCCGGRSSLGEACRARGLDVARVTEELTQLAQEPPRDTAIDWRTRPAQELLDHITHTHHALTRAELDRIPGLLAKVVRAHAERHPSVVRVAGLFEELRADLLPHLAKEEQVLFPYIRSMAGGSTGPECARFGSVETPVRMMRAEHEHAGAILAAIREATNDFTLPPGGGCTTYRLLYEGLANLESDLHRHIHLENDVLFPAASALEPGVARSSSANAAGTAMPPERTPRAE